ncbi:MAG: tyrosine--tRNA ligase [Candidatus Aenigmatarchaeota archaeon]
MDIDKRVELITRNTAETVSVDELRKLLEEKKQPTIYHGFEPSGGVVHIGYLIATQKHIDFQEAGLKLRLLFADLHAWLNEKGTLEEIAKTADVYKKCFAAMGVDMKKAECVMGSSFQLNSDYFKDVMKMSLATRLQRAQRAMTVIGREEENPHVAQLLYPMMQAIDIHYLADIAFGDLAQRKIHMLAREAFPSFGWKPPIAIHHVDMVALTGADTKMSASKEATKICINEDSASIRQKIRNAFCPKEIENNPLLQIVEYIIFPRLGKVKVERERKFGGDATFEDYKTLEHAYVSGELHPADLKTATAESLIAILEPIKKRLK